MTLPNKPKKFTSVETNFGTTIAKGLWIQAAQMLEYVNKSYPIGMLIYFYGSQAGLPEQPDPRFWKFMDGTAITNPDSPLYGISFPDLRNKFIRNPAPGESQGSTGGVSSIDLSHNHTGYTLYTDDTGPILTALDFGGDNLHAVGSNHRHTIDTTTIIYNTIPVSTQVQVYMRIL